MIINLLKRFSESNFCLLCRPLVLEQGVPNAASCPQTIETTTAATAIMQPEMYRKQALEIQVLEAQLEYYQLKIKKIKAQSNEL